MTIPLTYYLLIAATLFAIGVIGVLVRRNALVIFMSIELMLNAVNLTFISFARYLHSLTGQVFVFFIMVTSAAEVAVGLAIVVLIFKNRESINLDEINIMKW